MSRIRISTKWTGPVDEEGRPHGKGQMYDIMQDEEYVNARCSSAEEYFAHGYFDSAGRFIPDGHFDQTRPKGEPYAEIVFEGVYDHGKQVIPGSIRWACGYRYESVDNSEVMLVYKGDVKLFKGTLCPFPYPMLFGVADAIEGKKFYPDGTVEFEGIFQQRGLRFKNGTSYYKSGACRYTGEFSPRLTDQPHGNGTLWYENGNVWVKGEFYHGRVEKGEVFHEDGTPWTGWTKYDIEEYKP